MIIVTGGAGFIGSNIIAALNNIGLNDILVIDNLKNSSKYINLVDFNISDFLDKEDFIKNIVTNTNFGHIDVIFHEGACSSTTEHNGKYIMENNYQYSKDLLNYCMKYSIPFLYASSAAVYGNTTKSFIERRQYEKPLNIYGYSKFLFDQYVRMKLPYATSQICGLRYFNVYGPREGHKGAMSSMIFNLNNQINIGIKPKIFIGSEYFKRDFVYVKDIVAINIWCWQKRISGIFNCGTGQAESFKNIAKKVLNFHKITNLEYIPLPEELKRCYQFYTQANLLNLRSIGYNKSFITINEGIPKYLCWLN